MIYTTNSDMPERINVMKVITYDDRCANECVCTLAEKHAAGAFEPPTEGYDRWTVEFSFDVFDPAGRENPTEWDWGTIMAEAVGEGPDRIVEGAIRLYRVIIQDENGGDL